MNLSGSPKPLATTTRPGASHAHHPMALALALFSEPRLHLALHVPAAPLPTRSEQALLADAGVSAIIIAKQQSARSILRSITCMKQRIACGQPAVGGIKPKGGRGLRPSVPGFPRTGSRSKPIPQPRWPPRKKNRAWFFRPQNPHQKTRPC